VSKSVSQNDSNDSEEDSAHCRNVSPQIELARWNEPQQSVQVHKIPKGIEERNSIEKLNRCSIPPQTKQRKSLSPLERKKPVPHVLNTEDSASYFGTKQLL